MIAGTTAPGLPCWGRKDKTYGSGKTIIRELAALAQRIQQMLRHSEKRVWKRSCRIIRLVWDKLLVNVGINALTGITKLLNGELLEHLKLQSCWKMPCQRKEFSLAKGIKLGFPDPWLIRRTFVATAANKSSSFRMF